jgi:hypothetical protein
MNSRISQTTYFAEQVFALALSVVCAGVDGWAVYYTILGYYPETAFASWSSAAYIPALWTTEIALVFVVVNLLRFSFSDGPDSASPTSPAL